MSESISEQNTQPGRALILLGLVLLLALTATLAAISPYLEKHLLTKSSPILPFVILYMSAGVVWFFLMRMLHKRGWLSVALPVILIVGLAMRGAFFMSPVALEDDHYRYLWDGAVVVQGQSPYEYSPQQALDLETSERIAQEASKPEAQTVLEKVNHPEIKTIYPPVGQLGFAIAAWMKPYSVQSWRVVIFLAEIVVLISLLLILKQVSLPLAMVAIYWINPLIVREFYNAVHMDVLLLAFIVPAILFALKNRKMLATCLILLGVGIKFWPILLLPVLWRKELCFDMKALSKLLIAVAFSLLMVALLFFPILTAQFDSNSSLVIFSISWQNNDGIFKLFVGASWLIHELLGQPDWYVAQRARWIMMAVFIALYVYLLRKPEKTVGEMVVRMGMVVIIFFMLSATQMPWYFTWILPFMVIKPIWSLLAYVFLLPIYLLQFQFELYGQWHLFQSVMPWFEHVPVIIALYFERRKLGCFTCFDACPLPEK